MNKWLLTIMLISVSHGSLAGEAENISACVKKAKEFAGISLDPFAVRYEGNIVAMSTAKWDGTFCEVKLGDVYTLQIDGKTLIYRGYAGKDSYDLNASLQAKTEDAIRQMRSRIALLEQRASQVSVSLRRPNPDHKWLARYVDEGVQKSLGNVSQPVVTNSSRPTTDDPKKPVPEIPPAKAPQQTSTDIVKQSPQTKPSSEILIPRSLPGDQGKYYLLESKREGEIIKTLHKRIGVDATGYTRAEINCQSQKIREMGYSEVSPSAIQERATDWYDLVEGSSKSDLVKFVCSQ